METREILRLKELLQTATDLSEPSAFFWEKLSRNASFMAAGRIATNPRLQTIVERAVSHVLGGEQSAEMLIMLFLPEQKLWHGSCAFGSMVAQLIYFEDIDQGLLTIVDLQRGGMTYYVRVSVIEVEGLANPISMNLRNRPSS